MNQAKAPHSKPIFIQTFSINSLQAQRLIKRVFRRTVNALYSTEVILRVIGNEAEVDKIEQIINQLINENAQALHNEKIRIDKLIEANGIDETPHYTNPVTFEAKISSPQVSQFVVLIKKLDNLMISIDSIWLSGVITSKQRLDNNYAWQQRVMKLARRIIDIEIRARKSAKAKGKQAEVENTAPEESGEEEMSEDEESFK